MTSREHGVADELDVEPTPVQVDDLLSHGQKLRALGGRYTKPSPDLESDSTPQVMVLQGPAYVAEVDAFFSAVRRNGFMKGDYDPAACGALVRDPQRIREASMDELQRMLTWCVRGERFSDGLWESLLADGTIFALLDRLEELRGMPKAELNR